MRGSLAGLAGGRARRWLRRGDGKNQKGTCAHSSPEESVTVRLGQEAVPAVPAHVHCTINSPQTRRNALFITQPHAHRFRAHGADR